MMRITEHGQHFYVHMETTCTDIGMRMRMHIRTADCVYMNSRPCMHEETTCADARTRTRMRMRILSADCVHMDSRH